MLGPGISSEAIWTAFASMTTATIRPIKARVLIAWTRVVDIDNYAVIGTSLIGGLDILQGVGDLAINQSDSYHYWDETDRVLRIEYERNLIEPLGGTAIAMADIVLDNTDLRFTPTHNATIGTAIRPNRPIKIFIGFQVQGQEKLIPIIEGLSLQPKEDKNARTVTITVYDFMKFLNEKPLETAVYQDQRSDQIIADILAGAGVGSGSYALDQGLNTVGFAWFEKGQTAGDRIKALCEAEEAIFFQDESGILHFENRDKYSKSPYNSVVWTIEPDEILQWAQDYSSTIINRIIVSGSPRSVKAEAEVWRDGIEEQIPAGQTITVWAEFQDPVTSLTSPVSTTDYKAYSGTGGTGSDLTGNVSIICTAFAKAAKLQITNSSGSLAYLNLLKLRGTPATIDYEISEVFQDTVSIDQYNEQQKTITNDFIDKKTFAKNIAQDTVRRYKDPNKVIRLTIRGIPHLQLRDQVKIYDQDLSVYANYRVIGIQGNYEAGIFTQVLRLRQVTSSEQL